MRPDEATSTESLMRTPRGVSNQNCVLVRKVIVTVEEVVEKFEPKFSSIIIPSNLIDAISVVPNGAWPSYASDFYERDNNQYIAWDDISKDRDRFTEWLNSEIYSKNSAGK